MRACRPERPVFDQTPVLQRAAASSAPADAAGSYELLYVHGAPLLDDRHAMIDVRRPTLGVYFDVTTIASVLLAVFESLCGDANSILAVFVICCAVLGAVTVSEIAVAWPF